MDTSISVSSGDLWRPESAGRFNRVSDMLNAIGVIGPAGQYFPADAGGVITRINTSDATIPAASYVTFNSTGMRPGIEDPCGVTLAECAPGTEGPVQVSGIAEVSYYYPRPTDVLVLKGSSRNDRSTVLLNSTGHSTYRNYFKVSVTGWTDSGYPTGFSITDGGDPDSSDCGLTDVDKVSVGTLTPGPGAGDGFSTGYVCLRLTVDTSGDTPSYTHTFEWRDIAQPPYPWEPVVMLAEVVRRGNMFVAVQRWTGGMIYWRSRFVLGWGRGRV
jgi:hypothetical protein